MQAYAENVENVIWVKGIFVYVGFQPYALLVLPSIVQTAAGLPRFHKMQLCPAADIERLTQ